MAIWADATFVWDPGDAVTASSDLVSAASAAGITEGPFVSTPLDGRTYNGNVASRFEGLIAAANPQTTGMTLMAAIRCPAGGERILGITVVDKDDSNEWARLDVTNDSYVRGDYRTGGGSIGAAGWIDSTWNGTISADDIHVVVIRHTVSGVDMIVDTFVDGALYASGIEAHGGDIDMDRLSVGRLEDSSPSNSTGGQVFAAAAWDRPLTNAEVRAVTSDPYSYPTDPTDPDDWTVGVEEWEDTIFYWDPNHAGDRGLNLLYGGAPSDDTLAEGAEVTVSTVDGRQYNGTQGSRFNIVPLGLTDRFGAFPSSGTLMVAVARPGVSSDGAAFWAGVLGAGDIYSTINWTDSAVEWGTDSRTRTGSVGTDWMQARIAGTDADADIHVLVARVTAGGGSGTLALFLDSLATTDTDAQTFTPAGGDNANRWTVGRADDDTPSNAVNMQVFAAGYWSRVLTDDEVTAVLADPYGFPGSAPPPPPTPTTSRVVRSPRYGLTRVTT